MARASGIHGVRVEDPTDLPDAALGVLAHSGPALLDVVVNRQELSMPPKTTLDQMKGFSLYVLKAVMNGPVALCRRKRAHCGRAIAWRHT